jgi:hypothetical protein
MDIEKAREILESDDNERIYENDFSKGVAIISKYADTKFGYQFQHDQMWYGDFEKTVEKMTESEVMELAKHGWFEDEDSWTLFS